jgi:hypothetical protein
MFSAIRPSCRFFSDRCDLSAEQFVEIIVGSNPEPDYGISPTFADCSILFGYSHRPQIIVPG